MVGPLRHETCGRVVTIAVLNNDVALYVFCEHCNDLVEDGELVPAADVNARRFAIYDVSAGDPIEYQRSEAEYLDAQRRSQT